jgi:hypothetical protein
MINKGNMSNKKKLLKISSKPFSNQQEIKIKKGSNQERIEELSEILEEKNGFYSFEQALCIFPSKKSHQSYSLYDWNDASFWENKYKDTSSLFFFGEDIFGNKFCFQKNKVCFFNIETGEIEVISNTLEKWAEEILADYNYRTGYSLAHEWQKQNGLLEDKKRLLPNVPFTLGGEYSVENLVQADSLKVVEKASEIERKTRDLKDGTKVEI